MNHLPKLINQIRVALASHETVRIPYPRPKKLARELAKEMPVFDVRVDNEEVVVRWKTVP